jgi:hypothetical protein
MGIPTQFEKSVDYARNHEQDLRGKYGNDYLAMFGEYVLDHDRERGVLIGRVYSKTSTAATVMFVTLDEIVSPRVHSVRKEINPRNAAN